MDSSIEPVPQFGSLQLRIPPVTGGAEGKDSLFGPRFFFVSPSPAQNNVVAAHIEGLFQRFGLHDGRVAFRIAAEGSHSIRDTFLIGVYDELDASFSSHAFA